MNNILRIKNITKTFGHNKVLNSINLEIYPGIWGLLGPNGAGKTTLMRVLATVLSSDSGDISYGSINWSSPSSVKRLIGYVPQHFGMFPLLTIREALQHIAIMKNIDKANIQTNIDEVLNQVNLVDHQRKKIKELSGGMIKRLAIAQAILGSPQILILDEPTAGLDPEERIRFRNVISSIASQEKIILISTHIVGDVQAICENVVILNKGYVYICESVESMLSQENCGLSLEDAYMNTINRDRN